MIKPSEMTLRMSQVLEVFQGCQSFDGYHKPVGKTDNGDAEKSVIVPYDINGVVRMALAMNVNRLRPLAEAHQKSDEALRKQLLSLDFDPKTATAEEKTARLQSAITYNDQAKAALETEVEVKLSKISPAQLNLDKNPIPPNVLVLLAPILDEE